VSSNNRGKKPPETQNISLDITPLPNTIKQILSSGERRLCEQSADSNQGVPCNPRTQCRTEPLQAREHSNPRKAGYADSANAFVFSGVDSPGCRGRIFSRFEEQLVNPQNLRWRRQAGARGRGLLANYLFSTGRDLLRPDTAVFLNSNYIKYSSLTSTYTSSGKRDSYIQDLSEITYLQRCAMVIYDIQFSQSNISRLPAVRLASICPMAIAPAPKS
jgi:hypothetical protein